MKFPKRIEWQAGIVLVVGSSILLALCVALVVFRMDVGVEIAGILRSTENGMVLEINLEERHLQILANCKFVRIDDETRPRWYADIRSVAASWTQDTGLVAQIVIHNEEVPVVPGSNSRNVTGMLVESRQMEILRVLLQTLYPYKDRPKNVEGRKPYLPPSVNGIPPGYATSVVQA